MQRRVLSGFQTVSTADARVSDLGARAKASRLILAALLSTAAPAYAQSLGGGNATGANSTAVGTGATASGAGSLAVGQETQATEQNATAVGHQSQATGVQATALGHDARAEASNATAVSRPR